MVNAQRALEEITLAIAGDVRTDALHQGMFATDASMYQMVPYGVVYPASIEDLQTIVKIAGKYRTPLLPRGGGTSLAGQTVGNAIILDLTKYMHRVVEFNPKEKWMRVEPGITRDEVNAIAAKEGLEFAPDPATSSRATIGGMIANNSSGTKSILYGKTSDHVIELVVLLTDGSILHLGDNEPPASSKFDRQKQAEVNERLKQIVNKSSGAIAERFPKTMRRVSGYALDMLLESKTNNIHQVIIGSEGTLGIILEAKIRLVDVPEAKGVAILQFREAINAVKAVRHILPFQPAAIEILSKDLIDYSRKNLATKEQADFIEFNTEALLLVEFYSDTLLEIEKRSKDLFDALKKQYLGFAFSFYPKGEVYHNAWEIRKKGLGLLMGEPGDKRPMAFIEDAAIPVEVLPEYIEEVIHICQRYGVHATYYAHASVGVIHVRPFLDLRQQADIDIMKKISEEVFGLVRKYGGAWSGEHGDGLSRGEYIRQFFGDQLYAAFREVKELFDPEYLLNPGKMIDPPAMTENLRYGPDYHDEPVQTVYRYPEQRDFHTAVHQCSGLGACRKMQGGTMCPSFMATREEVHTTRGRANALRLAMSGQLSDKGLLDDSLVDALDLCISCKACKAECPSSVDMARLKGEVLQLRYDHRGTSLRDRLIRDSAAMARRFSGGPAKLVNAVQGSALFRAANQTLAGFDQRRKLPEYASQQFSSWFRSNYKDEGHEQRIGLFADTYTNYHEPQIGISAVALIQALGYDVDLLEGCCQRPKISHGFLKEARKSAASTCARIHDYAGDVLVCEPGCASAFSDDLPDLLEDETHANSIKRKAIPIEKWILQRIDEVGKSGLSCEYRKILLHGHCHQKALYGTAAIHEIFKTLDVDVIEPDSGCCGMAGSFGYEKEHYAISEKMYARVLGESILAHPGLPVAASGFSCRHQIAHFSGVNPMHWLELIKPRSDGGPGVPR